MTQGNQITQQTPESVKRAANRVATHCREQGMSFIEVFRVAADRAEAYRRRAIRRGVSKGNAALRAWSYFEIVMSVGKPA